MIRAFLNCYIDPDPDHPKRSRRHPIARIVFSFKKYKNRPVMLQELTTVKFDLSQFQRLVGKNEKKSVRILYSRTRNY